MVLVLYVVAGLMAVGGLAAVYSGSDIIVMERGWTMVIAGSVFAASGALLAGIATAVARLQGLQSEFARLSERLGRAQEPSFSPSLAPAPEMTGERSPEDRASPPPLVAVQDLRSHNDLDITPEPILSAPPREPPPAPAREPSVPVREPQLAATATDDALFDEGQPTPQADTPAVGAEPPPPTVVGTYNSGGNFYIMYSDGSIEAETPAGKFRFDSLDELKTFIAAGGDKAKATS